MANDITFMGYPLKMDIKYKNTFNDEGYTTYQITDLKLMKDSYFQLCHSFHKLQTEWRLTYVLDNGNRRGNLYGSSLMELEKEFKKCIDGYIDDVRAQRMISDNFYSQKREEEEYYEM